MAEVVQAMGPPTGRHEQGDGAPRLEFARGPMGKHTYMVDFDAQGGLLRWEQVLTENRFNAILAGMGQDEVLKRLGQPSQRRALPYQRQMVWSYRYESAFCQWFQIGVDLQGRVVDTGYYPDPLCDRLDPNE